MRRQIVMTGAIIALVGSCLYIVSIVWDYRYVPFGSIGFSLVLFGFSFSLLGVSLKEVPSTVTPHPLPVSEPLPTQQQPTAQFCPTCGSGLTWIPEYQRNYCYQCKKYV